MLRSGRILLMIGLVFSFLLAGCATNGVMAGREVVQFRPYPRAGATAANLPMPEFPEQHPQAPNGWPAAKSEVEVISPFGVRRGRAGGGLTKYHQGMDIKGPRGIPVQATANGEVSFAGKMSGYGNVVILAHGEKFMSLYGHLDTLDVEKGQPVRQGQKLGNLGATGNASTPHVHYEVRIDGKSVDPTPYLP